MKQARQRSAAAKSTPTGQGTVQTTAKPERKDWSLKLEVRLPHKLGQPLGSSASDGGSSD